MSRSSSAVPGARAALALLLAAAAASPALAQQASRQQQQGARPRQVVPMDSARAALLYVSNRHEDHPVADYAGHVAAKAVDDSIFAAQSRGVMQYTKTSYKSGIDGMEIPVYVFAPLQPRGDRAHAAMVWVHGGVHGNWTPSYLPFIKEAVAKGYVIVAPEYRGSTGYGREHHNAIDYGGKEVDDVLAAYDFLQTLPYVDTTRVGVMGWSHGGYIATLLLTREGRDTPFRAGAAMVPVTNLIFRLSYKGPGYQRSFSTQKEVLGLPFERREEYVRRSPYYHVDSLRTPLLVHVATNDTDVNIEEAMPLIDALVARKPDLAETKVYVDPEPGHGSAGHTFNRRYNPEDWSRRDSPAQIDSWNLTWAFFERHLKP